MDKPKNPCRKDCEYRSASCHNESCPHGWAEYEKKNIEFAMIVALKSEKYFATKPITAAHKRLTHNETMRKKRA